MKIQVFWDLLAGKWLPPFQRSIVLPFSGSSSPIGVNCLTLKIKVLWLLEMAVTVIKHIPEIGKSNYGIRFIMFVWLSIHMIFMKFEIWDFHAR
jgi:hypothetical protein